MRPIDKIQQPLQARPTKFRKATPCAVELSALFNCWRASAIDDPRCAESGTALAKCMSTYQPPAKVGSRSVEINKWLAAVRRGRIL
ncbi:hypothetical protein CXG81DRAFT_8518 [Caulochytrium protostelioides]|uniref:37S ribosomal protein mrp10, mitochondrial n=1 Tax=Caulochytrium protostelioides TaxID=1555241 RepID=A0A4P9XF82_9FUNG|nr:hypothetical protein CXG81DRAFT_8518 [Caulochytrium protostelioides]|eukprot:RKP04236.1 hypothetical protein CXG81DRAFT_8518 [Caulochytrium protostelioides]